MAGTRLHIQSLVLIEMLVLTAWSFFHGFCGNHDELCNFSSRYLRNFDLPSLKSTHHLPSVQVDKQLHPTSNLQWKINPNTATVCSQPDLPVVQDQEFWFCPNLTAQDPTRIVVRGSSMLIFSQESHLPRIVMPEVSSPFPLTVHIVLEETKDVAFQAQKLASSLLGAVQNLENWPCVNKVQVEMSVVKPSMSQKIFAKTASDVTGETTTAHLPTLDESEVQGLIESFHLSQSIGSELILYVPALQPVSVSSFQIGDSQLLMVGEWTASAVSEWLLSKMGVPVAALDTDGSVPVWYDEWYWYQASQPLSKDIKYLFSRVQHLVKEPLELGTSANSREHYHLLQGLRNDLELLLQTSRLQSDFPTEHYAAIFAPLLFPLLLPFLVGTIKELKRYKRKTQDKAQGNTEQDSEKQKED
jgi:Phosphatidylinositol-glycan biosynthesis class S protein